MSGRHRALVGIAVGESILQITYTTIGLPIERNSIVHTCGMCGLIVIFMLGNMYSVHLQGRVRDHPLKGTPAQGFIWLELHPMLLVSYVCIGAGFEAMMIQTSPSNSHKFPYMYKLRFWVLGIFFAMLITTMMGALSSDKLRAFRWFPKLAVLCFVLIPVILMIPLVILLHIDGFTDMTVKDQSWIVMIIVFFAHLWHVRLANKCFHHWASPHYDSLPSEEDMRRAQSFVNNPVASEAVPTMQQPTSQTEPSTESNDAHAPSTEKKTDKTPSEPQSTYVV